LQVGYGGSSLALRARLWSGADAWGSCVAAGEPRGECEAGQEQKDGVLERESQRERQAEGRPCAGCVGVERAPCSPAGSRPTGEVGAVDGDDDAEHPEGGHGEVDGRGVEAGVVSRAGKPALLLCWAGTSAFLLCRAGTPAVGVVADIAGKAGDAEGPDRAGNNRGQADRPFAGAEQFGRGPNDPGDARSLRVVGEFEPARPFPVVGFVLDEGVWGKPREIGEPRKGDQDNEGKAGRPERTGAARLCSRLGAFGIGAGHGQCFLIERNVPKVNAASPATPAQSRSRPMSPDLWVSCWPLMMVMIEASAGKKLQR